MVNKIHVARLSDAFEYKDWGGSIRFLLMPPDAPVRNVTLEIGTFKPGEKLKGHRHPESEEIYYVIRGKGHLRVGEEEVDLVERMALVIPPGHDHYLENNSSETLELAFITSPPEKWWLLERLEKLEDQVRKLASSK